VPVTCSGSGELTLAHAAQEGGSGVTGTTSVSVGSLTSFNADELDIKFCFGVIGGAATVDTASMTIYHAAVEGMPDYTALTDTAILSETTTDGRYCLVFDVGSVAATAGLAISGAGVVKYNWSFNSAKLGAGVMIDPREDSAPQLLAVLNGTTAACTTLAL
jgi:hypothetical protein